MDFMLRYRGVVPATGTITDKHVIRRALHDQLAVLVAKEVLLEAAREKDLPLGVLKGREVEVPRPLEKMYYRITLGGFEFVPLIHRPHELACTLEILFLRRGKPGAIIRHGGDLDNRLKTLFDALRMPHDTSELAGITPAAPGERVYCLLEDDSLITGVAVNTHEMLEPQLPGEDTGTVELLIHVVVHPTFPMIANLGW